MYVNCKSRLNRMGSITVRGQEYEMTTSDAELTLTKTVDENEDGERKVGGNDLYQTIRGQ